MLASASPEVRELLSLLRIPFHTISSDIVEEDAERQERVRFLLRATCCRCSWLAGWPAGWPAGWLAANAAALILFAIALKLDSVPQEFVQRVALARAKRIAEKHQDALVISVETVVFFNGEIIAAVCIGTQKKIPSRAHFRSLLVRSPESPALLCACCAT